MSDGLGIDFFIIVFYFIGLVTVGYFASKLINNVDDFAYSKGRLRFPVLLGTLLATAIGASATMGRAGKAYDYGFIIFIACIAYAAGLFVFSYIGPILRRHDIVSIPDVMEHRYGRAMRMLTAAIILCVVVGLAGVQIIAVGLLSAVILEPFGVTYETAVIVGAIAITLYTLMGGMMAVAYTDVVQVIVMVIALGLVLTAFLLPELGGFREAVDILPPEPGKLLGGLSPWYLLGLFFIEVPISIIDPALWQRSAGATSEKGLVRALRLTSLMFLAWGVLAVSFGVWAAHLLPDITADSAVPALVTEYLPPVARGLAISALLALMMSTADTGMLLAGTTVALDIVRPLRPGLSDRGLIQVTRLTIMVIGFFATLVALTVQGIFDLMMFSFAIYVSGALVPVIAALFWKRASAVAAIVSMILSVIALFGVQVAAASGFSAPWLQPIMVALMVSFVSFILLSRLTENRARPLALS